MAEQFEKSFDEILSDILTDYANLDDTPDTSVGSTPWLMASVLASMLWGLYRYQDYISAQHFPDTADTDNLNHWGAIYDITRLIDETDVDYATRILSFLRQAPAGGNALDYKNWALDHDESYYVGDSTYYNNYVTVESNPDGILGTVGIYTIPTDETTISLVNKQALRTATETYIESVRPLGLLSIRVHDATMLRQAIDIDVWPVTDGTVNTDDIKAAVETDMSSMVPGETIHKSTLTCIALNYGANYAVTNTPAANETTADNINYYRDDGTVSINYQG